MNDEFLKQYRKRPDPRFAERLYQRITAREEKGLTMNTHKMSMQRWMWMFASLAIVIAAALAASPAVRAAAVELVREIGGIQFHELSAYPGSDGEVEIVPSRYVSLAEARSTISAPISLPEYVPEGYQLKPEVQLIDFEDGALPMAQLVWQADRAEGGFTTLALTVSYPSEGIEDYGHLIGPDALQEVTVNGQPAGLVSGAWNYDTRQYERSHLLSLNWEYAPGVFYSLSAPSLGGDELIRIAESIP